MSKPGDQQQMPDGSLVYTHCVVTGGSRKGWQPIETAPLDGTALLLHCPGVKSWNRLRGMPDIVVGLWAGQWLSDIGDVDQGYESTGAYFEHEALAPTHWMQLPDPP
jgi:hypothetical protein